MLSGSIAKSEISVVVLCCRPRGFSVPVVIISATGLPLRASPATEVNAQDKTHTESTQHISHQIWGGKKEVWLRGSDGVDRTYHKVFSGLQCCRLHMSKDK